MLIRLREASPEMLATMIAIMQGRPIVEHWLVTQCEGLLEQLQKGDMDETPCRCVQILDMTRMEGRTTWHTMLDDGVQFRTDGFAAALHLDDTILLEAGSLTLLLQILCAVLLQNGSVNMQIEVQRPVMSEQGWEPMTLGKMLQMLLRELGQEGEVNPAA